MSIKRSKVHVVAEYRERASEGIHVVSKNVIDGLRARGMQVTIVDPGGGLRALGRLAFARPQNVVFTHGPGRGVVLASLLLRLLTRARIVWVATRPDLSEVPGWLTGRKTAHAVLCNEPTAQLRGVARDARLIQQFIGIDPLRVRGATSNPWPQISERGRPVVLHVGHLKRNRGLNLLAETKRVVGDTVEMVVVGSPTFPPEPAVVDDLRDAGVWIHREYVSDIAALYQHADLYAFPVTDSGGAGAIDLPLSVLEAVAAGLPVLTTSFGSLGLALRGVEGVRFTEVDTFGTDLEQMIEDLRTNDLPRPVLPASLDVRRVTGAVHAVVNAA